MLWAVPEELNEDFTERSARVKREDRAALSPLVDPRA